VNLFDLTIIYLALGAPLGVYHIATHWEGPAVSTVSFSALNVFLWPVAAFAFAFAHLRNTAHSHKATMPACIASLNSAAASVFAPDKAFEMRNVLEAYVGLSEALEREIGTSAIEELAALTGLSETAAPRAVARRTTHEKLLRHQASARAEMLRWMTSICAADPDLRETAVELASCLGDHIAADEFAAIPMQVSAKAGINSDQMSLAA